MLERKLPKKIHPAESHFTYHLAVLGFEAIMKELNVDRGEDRNPLDGDLTEAISKRLLYLLDENEGIDTLHD